MDADSDRPPDPLAAWLAATQGAVEPPPATEDAAGATPRPGRRRLLLLAAVPWIAVLGLGGAVATRSAPAPPGGQAPVPTASVPSELPGPVPAEEPTGAATASGPGTDPPGAPGMGPQAVPELDPRLTAAAVLAVRRALPDDQYLDTAVVDGSAMDAGTAIVTVAGAVLDRVGGRWVGPREVRFAVPMTPDPDRPAPRSSPWVLPPPTAADLPSAATPIQDADLAAAAAKALRTAGYRRMSGLSLGRHPSLPDVLSAQLVARAPGEPATREHEVWLDAAAARLLGTPSPPASDPPPPPLEAEPS